MGFSAKKLLTLLDCLMNRWDYIAIVHIIPHNSFYLMETHLCIKILICVCCSLLVMHMQNGIILAETNSKYIFK